MIIQSRKSPKARPIKEFPTFFGAREIIETEIRTIKYLILKKMNAGIVIRFFRGHTV